MEITNKYKLDIAKNKKLNRDDFISKKGFENFKNNEKLSITCKKIDGLHIFLYSDGNENVLYEIYKENNLIFWINLYEDFVFFYDQDNKIFMFPYGEDNGYIIFNPNDNSWKEEDDINKSNLIRYDMFYETSDVIKIL